MHLYVETDVDDDGYPPFNAEEIHAEELGPGRARLVGIPTFVYGMARGDVVQFEVRRTDGLPWVVAVLENSDHWTARVLPLIGEDPDSIAREFIELGCDAHPTTYGVVPIDVPPAVAKDLVLRALRQGLTSKRWDFDLGVDPEASASVQPTRGVVERVSGWFGRHLDRR